jgi:myo-inositol-hexaphosphate 3-phosphohydrolase
LAAPWPWSFSAQPFGDIRFETQTEGCVADDETGAVYVADEDAAATDSRHSSALSGHKARKLNAVLVASQRS